MLDDYLLIVIVTVFMIDLKHVHQLSHEFGFVLIVINVYFSKQHTILLVKDKNAFLFSSSQ